MQEWQVFSWNTQGDFTNGFKMAEIDSMFDGLRVVGLIQEGGVDKSGAQGEWLAYGGYGVGAYNERCTNYVLVKASYARFATVEPLVLKDGKEAVVVGGGVAGRTPAAVGIGRTLFVSWHSLSGESNEDTALLVRAIESNEGYRAGYDTVLIGGDFNAAPAEIEQVVSSGSERSRAAWAFKYRTVISSGAITHPGSDTELDFFVVMSKSALKAVGPLVSLRGIGRRVVGPSDHHPVRMSIMV